MIVSADSDLVAERVLFDFDDYVRYSEMHPDGDFELLDGVIYQLSPEGKSHLITRLRINTYLHQILDLSKYTVGTEGSFPAPGWKDGPKPDNFVSRGALSMDEDDPKRPSADDMLLVIEITNVRSGDKNIELQRKLDTYARLAIPEYWLIDLVGDTVIVYRDPVEKTDGSEFDYIQIVRRNETLCALAVESLTISSDLLLKLAQKA